MSKDFMYDLTIDDLDYMLERNNIKLYSCTLDIMFKNKQIWWEPIEADFIGHLGTINLIGKKSTTVITHGDIQKIEALTDEDGEVKIITIQITGGVSYELSGKGLFV